MLLHAPRQPAAWLIFDVGQKMARAVSSILLLVLSGCASDIRLQQALDERNRRLELLGSEASMAQVDLSDGVSEVEAFKIACGYFFGRGFAPCGMVDVPKNEGAHWRVPILEGIFPGHTSDVVISKIDGSYHIEYVKRPNKAPEPTPTSVTSPAGAGDAPAAVVAHL